mgnify:CR=1 FL=1
MILAPSVKEWIRLPGIDRIGEFEREFMRTLDEEFPGSVFSTTISRYKDYGRLLSNKQLIYTRDRAKATDFNKLVDECIERIWPQHIAGEEVGA